MEPQANIENQNLNSSSPSNLPLKNSYKILFFISLELFLVVSSVLTTLIITQKFSKPTQTAPTDIEETELTPTETIKTETESITPIQIETTSTPTKSATVTSSTKTAFQKMITDFTLYKDITSNERLAFTKEGNYWPSFTKSSDKLYSFVQKLIKGSIKTLVIDHNNLKNILTSVDFKNGYDYTFYLTPNYESWTPSEFKNLDYEDTGIGDLTPIYAYSDKLIWTTRNNCGGARPENIESQKAQDQCVSLIKEIETAFP